MTLISILGDFHSSIIPITYEFKKEITQHVIVYDDAHADKEKLKSIQRGQNVFFETLPHDSDCHFDVSTMEIDEDSYESINRCFDRILLLENNPKEIYLNTTDGLSSIAIVLSSKLLEAGSNVISYDRFDNTYNLHTKEGMSKHKMKYNMDVKSHLLMKGYTFHPKSRQKEVDARKEAVMKLCENLPAFKEFANQYQGKNDASLVYGNEEYKRVLESIGKLNDTFFIQGTVFEEYIYHLIVDNLDFDDVMVSVSVVFTEFVKNEFDILMIKDNHLHTIECKFKKNLDGKPMVYMMAQLVDYLDDDSKAMILNIGGDNKNTDTRNYSDFKFDNADKHRARYGDIKLHVEKEFDEKKFLKDVKNWFCKNYNENR